MTISAASPRLGTSGRKLLVTFAIAAAFLALIGWISPEQATPPPLPPRQLFDVSVAAGSACIELPFASEDASYLLVTSNLSRQVEPAQVELHSEAVAGSDGVRGNRSAPCNLVGLP